MAASHQPASRLAEDILQFAPHASTLYKRIRLLEFAELPKTISGKRAAEDHLWEDPRVELREDAARKAASGRVTLMDRVTLKALLDAEQVDPAAYSLEGGMPSEAYVLEPRAADWAVYYSERGLRSDEVVFHTENEACSYLLDLVLSDDTTREPR